MDIITGKQMTPLKIVIYGPEGIGKSTFAARFPRPVFIDTEGSTKHMDVARTPRPASWAMLMEQVRYFRDHPGEFATLVIDTADWAEQLCITDLCARSKKPGIEDFGYGKGYIYLAEDFERLLNLLEEVIEHGMNVVATAHAKMRKFEQPDEMGAYDRWELKLQKTTAPLLKEWADMVLFANYKTHTIHTDDGKIKAQGGKRVMYTTHHPCWDAKNRHGLSEELPFDFDAIRTHIPCGGRPAPAAQGRGDSNPVAAPTPPAQEPPKKESPVYPDQNTLPAYLRPLYDLMREKGVEAAEVQAVVGARGYFPADMPLEDYPEDFVTGVLIGAWDQVCSMILEAHPLPF